MATFMIFLPIIILSGVGGIVGGFFIVSDMYDYQSLFDIKVVIMPVVMLLSSVLVLGVALVGCAGVIKESSLLVMSFAISLGLIFLVKLGLGITAIALRIDLEDYIHGKLQKAMTLRTEDEMKAWNILQNENRCCGIHGPKDWIDVNVNIPSSCCRPNLVDINTKNCLNSPPILQERYWADGCLNKLHRKVSQNEDILIGVGIGSAFIHCLGVVLGCMYSSSLE